MICPVSGPFAGVEAAVGLANATIIELYWFECGHSWLHLQSANKLGSNNNSGIKSNRFSFLLEDAGYPCLNRLCSLARFKVRRIR